ncbi:MAG: hypothetical protein MI747_07105 [Desulfobacterales bacterium]|nr:hypothetical protein [Desulfobacterales bacterium]
MTFLENNHTLGQGGRGIFSMGRPDLVFKPQPSRKKIKKNSPDTRVEEDVWALEKRIFLNQIVLGLQGGEEPDILFPILNKWEGDIIQNYRQGKLSVGANDTLSAYMEAAAYDAIDSSNERFMVMDNLGQAIWAQSEFTEDLMVQYGYDPFVPDIQGELMDTLDVKASRVPIQRLIAGINSWLLKDILPADYEVQMLNTVLKELTLLLNTGQSSTNNRYLYSAVYRKNILFAFSRFRKEGRDFIQDCRGTSPAIYSEGALTSGELMTLWYVLIPGTRLFSAGRRMVVDNAQDHERTRLLNMLFFRPMDKSGGFRPIAGPEDIQLLYLHGLRRRASRLLETCLPNLKILLKWVPHSGEKVGAKIRSLEDKTLRLENWLRKTDKLDPNSRMGVHLTIVEEEWRILVKELLALNPMGQGRLNMILGPARDLFNRSLYNQWDFADPFQG